MKTESQGFFHLGLSLPRRGNTATITLKWTACVLMLFCLSAPGHAITINWNCVNGAWNDTSCWNPTQTPTPFDIVNVNPVSGSDTTLGIGAGTSATTGFMIVDSTTANSVQVQQSGGTLSVDQSEIIGSTGTATFIQSGGTHSINNILALGNYAGAHGIFSLQAGNLTVTIDELIGASGSGTFTQSGGIHTVTSALNLGLNTGGSGTYQLSAGNLSTAQTNIGFSGSGAFTQNGGKHMIGNELNLGYKNGSTGTYGLANGDLSAGGPVFIGRSGTGTFTQNGGTHTTSTHLYLGYDGSGNGTYELTTGTLSVSGDEFVGRSGTGAFTQTGGAHTVTNALYLGYNTGSDGSYDLSGGNLSAGNLYIGGSTSAAGGSGHMTVRDGSTASVTDLVKVWNTGTLTLSGGTLNTLRIEAAPGGFDFQAGTLNIGGDLAGSDLGTTALTLTGPMTLTVAGTTRLDGASTLTLNGGTFSTASLSDNGGFTFRRGTFNLTGDDLVVGTGGLFGSLARFEYGQTMNVTHTTTISSGAVLALNDGRLTSGAIDNQGRITLIGPVASLGGGTLNNAGLIDGNGQIEATLNNAAGGEVRVLPGDTLTFTASGNTNAGRISLLGGTTNFQQGLTNTGLIAGHGTLAAGATTATGIDNQGGLALSGSSDVIGDLNNDGTIVVSGSATATFHDDVTHNGTEFRVSAGSQAVFLGSVSGSGPYTGTGTLFFEGDLLPGNSPSLVNVEGDMVLGMTNTTVMELGGLVRGTEYDAFDIGGSLTLGGALDIDLSDPGSGLFTPQAGDGFDLFIAETISGSFDNLQFPTLDRGLRWELAVLADATGTRDIVRLNVAAVPLPAAGWLFGVVLPGLAGLARRGKYRVRSCVECET